MSRDPRLDNDEDFIISKKYNYSLKNLLMKNPNGVKDSVICKVLDITMAELQHIYENALNKLRIALGEEDE